MHFCCENEYFNVAIGFVSQPDRIPFEGQKEYNRNRDIILMFYTIMKQIVFQ